MIERVKRQQEWVDSQTKFCVILWWLMSASWIITAFLTMTGNMSLMPSNSNIFISRDYLELLRPLVFTCSCISVECFVTGQVTGNVSQVDKLWSLLPPFYSIIICYISPIISSRLVMMTTLATLWGARLTYNFTRRGGYSWPPWKGEEDYRWTTVRTWPLLNNKVGWMFFNLIFISIYQNFLLLLLAVPALVCLRNPTNINSFDLLIGFSFLTMLILETVADQQQYEYQTEKLRQTDNKIAPYTTGFVTWGLFSLSRHPNFFAEQFIWIFFYMFSVSASGSLLNPSIIGCLLLVALFQGSTLLSEGITGKKYELYRVYQKKIPMFFGNFWSYSNSYLPVYWKE